jgi:hypothetical protein
MPSHGRGGVRFVIYAYPYKRETQTPTARRHTFGHSVLQIEDVVEPAIKAIGPQMRSSRRVDELASNAHSVSGLAHAAFEHIANTQLTPDLLKVSLRRTFGRIGDLAFRQRANPFRRWRPWPNCSRPRTISES